MATDPNFHDNCLMHPIVSLPSSTPTSSFDMIKLYFTKLPPIIVNTSLTCRALMRWCGYYAPFYCLIYV